MRIIFDFKAQAHEGYRIYEIEIDPVKGERIGKLRQINPSPQGHRRTCTRNQISYQ